MAKIATDLEQSKKLAEILPTESADMYYSKHSLENFYSPIPSIGKYSKIQDEIPCWSIAALIEILPKIHGLKPILDLEECSIQYSGIDLYVVANNPVDACYEMIIKLKEDNLL